MNPRQLNNVQNNNGSTIYSIVEVIILFTMIFILSSLVFFPQYLLNLARKLVGRQPIQPNINSLPVIINEIEVNVDPQKMLDSLKISSEKAREIYQNESRMPFRYSKIGGTFGILSSLRHTSKEGKELDDIIRSSNNPAQAKAEFINMLHSMGSFWDFKKGFNHSYTNYFLSCLRHENIDAYRNIIGEAYGIKFIHSSITLYRRDTRNSEIIFKSGFELKTSINNYNVRKSNYAEPVTESFGVSFSKQIPPTHYGQDGYYQVVLSAEQNFLLIDIVESPRNKNRLSNYQINLKEVNSIDDIPAAAVLAYYTSSQHTLFAMDTKINKDFSPNALAAKKLGTAFL